jgi:hypothetical protein
MKYDFSDETDSTAVIALSWEKRRISFKVAADVKRLQIEAFKSDFRTTRPYIDYITAAQWCLENNYELEQALAWMDRGIYFRIMGEKNFRSLSTKAAILTKLNRHEEAKKIMDEALPMGSVTDVHFYARNLQSSGQTEEAVKVFVMNYNKHPQEFITNVGMGRAMSAKSDYKKANVAAMIKKLEEGKDINK